MEENKTVELTDAESASNQTKPEWEQKLKEMMKDAYCSGLSRGGKTFVGVIYEAILDDRAKKQNPAKTVMRIEAMCKRMLGMEDYKGNFKKPEEEKSTETSKEKSDESSKDSAL